MSEFRGGWPVAIKPNPDTLETIYMLSDGSEVEGEEAFEAQDKLPWPRPFRSPRGGYVTSDRYRFFNEERAKARQAHLDGEDQ